MASSRYFAALLGPNFRDCAEKKIVLDEIDGPMLKTILDFVYTGIVEINGNNVDSVVAAASKMELIALEERCGEFWGANLALANCVEVFLNADKYQFENLRVEALKFVCNHFEDISNDDFRQFDANNFHEVLGNDQIAAAETIVFDRLAQWLSQNGTGAKKRETELLQLIRLEHIPFAVG